MKKLLLAATLSVTVALPPAAAIAAPPGMVIKASPHSASATLDRLESALKENDTAVALRWDHGARAEDEGIDTGPVELLVFGNPALGSHLFTSAQTAGVDLPMKALAWTDERGQTWLGYNDPGYIAQRHGIDDRDEILAQMENALDKLSDAAVAE